MNLQSETRKLVSRRGRCQWESALAAVLLLLAVPGWAQHAPGSAAPPLPAVGETIGAFDGRGSNVLLFFLSSCPTCHRMIPEWNRAFARKAQGVEVVGVLMDREPPGFFQTNRVAFPVVRAPGRDFLQKLKVSRAPLMVRVARGGRVEDVALGYTDPIRVGEIFRP